VLDVVEVVVDVSDVVVVEVVDVSDVVEVVVDVLDVLVMEVGDVTDGFMVSCNDCDATKIF
jgi:hypothetical protein